MGSTLTIRHSFDVPLEEVSGLAIQRVGGGARLLAVGDEAFDLVAAPLDASGDALGGFERTNMRPLLSGVSKKGGSQWEAVACDAAGRVFVVQETPGNVFVFDPALGRLVATIELSADGPAGADWARSDNSRGEGLVPLAGGHLLVLKEKGPPQLVEFGPAGDAARGVTRASFAPAPFELPASATSVFVPLAKWELSAPDLDEIEDLSDVAVGPRGTLLLVSDEARCLVEVDPELGLRQATVRVTNRWDLPKKVKEPEGLAVTADGHLWIAVDRAEEAKNLFLIEGLA